ncbi:putative transferase CAF17 homolog, mitochondrial [Patella vulgata]|uniref:putative transferase CAF17 homolog, mitochondrial n=1 Tax=Patella vulgata TaxID=6465 RepID=UPI00217FD44B|nr:putative transferase CAF17 homolog, mitochondrial [Patella vulgata]
MNTCILNPSKCLLYKLSTNQTAIRFLPQIRRFSKTQDPKCFSVKLKSRSLVQVCGKDTLNFLQGLFTSDVNLLNDNVSQYSMMLNVQGRVLYDLLLYNMSAKKETANIWIECASEVKDEFIQTMKKYKIRKKVDISDISKSAYVYASPNQNLTLMEDSVKLTTPDPRLPSLGNRIIVTEDLKSTDNMCVYLESEQYYREHRYKLGIGEGITDLPPGSCFPLESNLTFLKGVSFEKGCYIGQELTARTFHTGVTRKRLMPLVFENVPAGFNPDSSITSEKGKSAGKLRDFIGIYGLGLMRVAETKGDLNIIDIKGNKLKVKADIPSWWPSENHML